MSRKLAIAGICLLTILLIISGCKQSSSILNSLGKKQSSSTESAISELRTGTDGFLMIFMEGTPPDEIFVGDTFRIGLEMRNFGASDVVDGKIYVSGYDENSFSLTSQPELTINIEGKSKDNIIGGYGTGEFEFMNIRNTISKKGYFAVNACYNYNTKGSIPICLSPPQTGPFKKSFGCGESTYSSSTGQGGPIGISEVETRFVAKDSKVYEAKFILKIKNMGLGYPRSGEYCQGLPIITINKIAVGQYSTDAKDDRKMECKSVKVLSTSSSKTTTSAGSKEEEQTSPADKIILGSNAEAKVTCTALIAKDLGKFTTPLQIDLSYGYTQILEKSISIKEYSDLK